MSTNRPKQSYEKPRLRRYGRVTHLTRNGQGSGNDTGTMFGMSMMSDLRCKTDLVRVGSHPAGFGLYLFRYLPAFRAPDDGGKRHFGVLAQEVEALVPEAVQRDTAGYLRVNNDLLGICRAA